VDALGRFGTIALPEAWGSTISSGRAEEELAVGAAGTRLGGSAAESGRVVKGGTGMLILGSGAAETATALGTVPVPLLDEASSVDLGRAGADVPVP